MRRCVGAQRIPYSCDVLDTVQLRMLQQIALLGSYSAAARELGYTQPAVTYQIRNLEKSIGAPIAVRRGREMHLTGAGRELLGHAEHILAAVHTAEEAMAVYVGVPRGRIRVAAFPSSYATLVADAVAALMKDQPGLEVELIEAEPARARQMVRFGDADLAVAYRFKPSVYDVPTGAGRVEGGELSRIHLLDDHMQVVLPPEHPAAAAATVGLVDLQDDVFLIASSRFSDIVDRAGADLGFAPRTASVADDFVAMQSMVAHGLGVALVSDLGLAAHRDRRVVVRPLRDWPDRVLEVELWPDLLRLGEIKALIHALHDAAGRLVAAAERQGSRPRNRR